ncbi:hypothetical protein RRG08_009866 [Elysia crispata]|uniref:Uncharacterized protein n=1 Tax=Elysia crispata TaxID=231223 RepID=A0AAE1DAM3_9GAST|nr:hypothetical protein RRG08_009866 [Elysia crispata]
MPNALSSFYAYLAESGGVREVSVVAEAAVSLELLPHRLVGALALQNCCRSGHTNQPGLSTNVSSCSVAVAVAVSGEN